ncbi:MAG: methyltransferase, TIGR04325 family [Burkholderiales bacterium]|nr:methyltransferase, TIGR04325 family [Burkholderiales bacterium]
MRRLLLSLGGWRAAFELGRIASSQVKKANRFELGFDGWEAATAASNGYASPAILNKVITAARDVRDGKAAYERDAVTFAEPAVDHALVAWSMYACARQGALRVLDFGGALGSLYYQHRRMLDGLVDCRWGVVEQEHFVRVGRDEFETTQLQFFDSIEECVHTQAPNFLLMAGVLQYLPAPYEHLERALGLGLPFLLLHRTMARHMGPDQIAVQHVSPLIYPASYPVWMLDAQRIERTFSAFGYDVIDRFDPYPGSFFGPDDQEETYKSWFVARQEGGQ